MLQRNGCPSHQDKDACFTLLCVIIWKAKTERRGYGTALYKARCCKQTHDCTNSVNYKANEKLKGSSNKKFDQMLFRLSFQVIKWSGKKRFPKVRFSLWSVSLRKKKMQQSSERLKVSFPRAMVFQHGKIQISLDQHHFCLIISVHSLWLLVILILNWL